MTPQKVDLITCYQYCHLVSVDEPDPGYAEIWSNAGFGRIDMSTFGNDFDVSSTAQAVLWLDNDNTTLQGRHWVTSPSSWAQWESDRDAPGLIQRSWRFLQFLQNKDYVYPDLDPPITWVEHSSVVWSGYRGADVALAVRKHGQGWQWAIRGERGADVWHDVANLIDAKAEAEAAITGA